jgi:response regulator RpfG family c-di-GMP phosphodiesterase
MTDTTMQEKATILIVDDDADNLTLMSGLLKDKYKVKVANSGIRALKIAQSGTPPDLILLDIMMPEMNGYEVCQDLKYDPSSSDIPVIFLTAKSTVEDEKRGLEMGALDYITKPISPPILLARVKNHLSLKLAADFLREKNSLLGKEVEKFSQEILGLKTGVFVDEIDKTELNEVVLRLAKLLADDDAEAIDCLEEHNHLLLGAFQSDFMPLQKSIHNYNFADALIILKDTAIHWQIFL